MNLTNAQQILIAQINEASKINGNDPITEAEILQFVQDMNVEFIFKAMEAYGKLKWEEACAEMWKATNNKMGDLSLEDSLKLCNVIHPEFKP